MKNSKIQKNTIAAMMAALTCIATMILKIQTPTFGYIHLGDGLVLLCGIILGPSTGALAAGIGSMLADVLNGYLIWAPGTFLIKACSAAISGLLYYRFSSVSKKNTTFCVLPGGILSEAFMVLGYFFYEVLITILGNQGFSASAFAAGCTSAATGIPFNLVQGFTGIVLSVLLLPILQKSNILREWMFQNQPSNTRSTISGNSEKF